MFSFNYLKVAVFSLLLFLSSNLYATTFVLSDDGLIDERTITKIEEIGNVDQILKEKFGEKLVIKSFEKPKGFIARKLSSSLQNPIENFANSLEEKTMWQKFGL